MQTNNLIQGQKILKVSYFSSWPLWHNKTPSLWCMFLCAGICFETLPNAYTRTKIKGFGTSFYLKIHLIFAGDLFSTNRTCTISRYKSWQNTMQAKKWKSTLVANGSPKCMESIKYERISWNNRAQQPSFLICLYIYYIRQVPLSWLK